MHWEAHGHRYALSRTIDDDIRAGRTVVANVSRTVIAKLRRAYADVVWFPSPRRRTYWRSGLPLRARGSDGRHDDRLNRDRRGRLGRARRDHRQRFQCRMLRAPIRAGGQSREWAE